MSTFESIILASVIVSSISLVGGVLIIWKELLTEKFSTYLVSFAAGVMLTTAFVDLLPEALNNHNDQRLYFYGLLGVVTFFLIERFVLWFHHHDKPHTKPSVYLILLGDGLHNFFDGLAIAATFLTNPGLGFITTVAISTHEIPQEIADFSILIHGGMDKVKALFYNFLSALTAFLGAILGFYYLEKISGLAPFFLMFSAGVFIYIACSDLIPDLHQDFKKQKKWRTTIPFIIGIILTYILITLLEFS
jgi:zinc and cadmium transporter